MIGSSMGSQAAVDPTGSAGRWDFYLFFTRYVSKCLQAQIQLIRKTQYRCIALSQVETLFITPQDLVMLRRTNQQRLMAVRAATDHMRQLRMLK
jgi:hypothetical protein